MTIPSLTRYDWLVVTVAGALEPEPELTVPLEPEPEAVVPDEPDPELVAPELEPPPEPELEALLPDDPEPELVLPDAEALVPAEVVVASEAVLTVPLEDASVAAVVAAATALLRDSAGSCPDAS